MDTPTIKHFTAKDYEHIYEPAEDSFLLLDALEKDLPYIAELQPSVCVEIGSGSGVVITALARQFKEMFCMATDINPYACEATKRTATENSIKVDTIRCNLVDTLRPNTIDLLIFNPPYVITSDDELQQSECNLSAAWAGGQYGRKVIAELLTKLNISMSIKSVFYLLLLRENKPEEIINQLSLIGFKAIKFMERRIPGEYLYILKVIRN